MLRENTEFGKALHVVFVDLEKFYDKVPRELINMVLAQTKRCSRGLHLNIIRDKYAGSKTSVMASAGRTKEIEIEV